jgi:tRNA nucleotidyltransferase (CCA-adding enzyme)
MPDIYLVGGAVRDKLLKLTPKEHDWVVVGATPDFLLKQGYLCVGKDFPVFLHPETKEEYALARTERKTAPGYTGFEFTANEQVTLEQDLSRRDLTINAIAEDAAGQLIDPYHGIEDLQQKILRHVSPAFVEDPVRILRVARFAARFANLGFTVAPETMALMCTMVANGEVNALVAERVWKETEKALQEANPHCYFEVLQECGALTNLFAPIATHYAATMRCLTQAANTNSSPLIRFIAMLSPLTPNDIKQLCKTVAVPNEYKTLAMLTAELLPTMTKLDSADKVLKLLNRLDAFRRPERFQTLLTVLITLNVAQHQLLADAYALASEIEAQQFIAQGVSGKALGEQIQQARLVRLQQRFSEKM